MGSYGLRADPFILLFPDLQLQTCGPLVGDRNASQQDAQKRDRVAGTVWGEPALSDINLYRNLEFNNLLSPG